MVDVGRLAGVSHQTVSRVINGSRHVSPATRARVLHAMDELGYQPNSIARALATGRTRTVGVVSSDTTLYGPASTLLGIQRAAHQTGYFTLVASLRALERVALADAIERLRMQGVDGILAIISEVEAAAALREARADVPIVAAESGPDSGVPVVAVDQHAGGALATRYLLDLGHPTVHHVAGPANSLEARARTAGWRASLKVARGSAPPPSIGDWSARAGYHLGTRLARDPTVSAVFVANDQMALGLLRALSEQGRAVPDDVSVVGYDDIPEATYFTPPLTTVRQDLDEVGSRSMRTLVAAIEARAAGRPPPPGSIVAPELIVRASAAAPRSRVDVRRM